MAGAPSPACAAEPAGAFEPARDALPWGGVVAGWPRDASGQLRVGGVPVRRLAERAGSTPFFAYDRALVRERVTAVRAALPEEVLLRYAVKANPMPALLHHLSTLVDGFDVASGLELRHALDTGVPPEQVSFAGPGKSTAELRQAVAAGVTVELESAGEAERIHAVAAELGLVARVALRVNPDFAVRGAGVRLGGGAQQFGVDAERVPELLAALNPARVDMLGFHVFAGSQNLRAESICEAQSATVDLVLALAETAPQPVRYVNLGGGLGIPYAPKDGRLDLVAVGEHLAKLLATRLRPALPEAKVVLELGRYLVGEAGLYVTRVVDRKVSRGRTFLVVDGGMHHQLAASGNLGQVIRRNYPIAVAERPDDPGTERVSVVGCLCTPLDQLGDDVELPVAGPGDLIALFQAGAYGRTASPTGFLSHPEPVELLV